MELSDKDMVLAHYKNSGEPMPVCAKKDPSYRWTSFRVTSGPNVIGAGGNASEAWRNASRKYGGLDKGHNITRYYTNSEFIQALQKLHSVMEYLGEAGKFGVGEELYTDLLRVLNKHGISTIG